MVWLKLSLSVALLCAVPLVVFAAPAEENAASAKSAATESSAAAPEAADPFVKDSSPPGTTAAKPANAEQPEPKAVEAVWAKAASAKSLGTDSSPIIVKLRTGEREKAIEKALNSPTQIEFVETPLADVIQYLKEFHQIEIQFDKKTMDEVAVNTDTLITKRVRGISLRSALNLILRDLDLAWIIQDEVLLITTKEKADAVLYIVIYDVADLVTCRDDANEVCVDFDSLITAITTTIQPTTWDEAGGQGSIAPGAFGAAKVILVAQTGEVQEQIADLLATLRSISNKAGENQKIHGGTHSRKPKSPAARAAARQALTLG